MLLNVVPFKKTKLNPFEEIKSSFEEQLKQVDNHIKTKLSSHVDLVGEMATHLMKTGGKRLRPLLTVCSSEMFGYKGNRHINLAACVELIHNATLLHDDVIDNSNSRRGFKTTNAIWGNKSSILAGDYLLSRCFEMMVNDGSEEVLKILSSVSSEIAQGEIMQLQFEKQVDMVEKNYLDIISAKTASLFGASMRVGGCINNRSKKEKEALESYGRNLGICFQITDDILDYFSREKIFGKKIGNDFKEGKITLPIILLFQKSNSTEREMLNKFFAQNERSNQDFDQTLNLIKKYEIINICKKRADYFSNVASDSLSIFEKNFIVEKLQELSFYIVNRLN
ncbi:MAG: polyprenyl synthetase family protein [Pelagibacteraceae bacterium]